MQLTSPSASQATLATPKDSRRVRLGLAAATAALLGSTAQAQTTPAAPTTTAKATTSAPTWQVDSALLVYSEGGGRVTAVEPVVQAKRTDGNDHTWGLKLTLDTLTGASPNGAVAQPTAQTFTSPSGNSQYNVAAGKAPLDPSFKDTRAALALSYERPLDSRHRLSLGGGFSQEYDFTSLNLNASLARDFNDKNTTISLGVAFEQDQLRPVGGTPVGLRPTTPRERTGQGTRQVSDLLLGLTQVMNRRWLTQVNLGWGRGSGEHSDPYKLLSVVDGGSGLLTGDQYVHEKRPDQRTRTSLFWQNKVHLEHDVVDVGYRYYRDDWGVQAHTLDTRYRWALGEGGRYIEPRWRFHRQTAADFWRGWLIEGSGPGQWNSASSSTSLVNASADPRLGAFTAHTLGATVGWPLRGQRELTLRLEAYRQQPKQPANAPGVLQQLPVAPALNAVMLTVGYSFPW
jgi:hypothetical protein